MDRKHRQSVVVAMREEGVSFEEIASKIDPDYRTQYGEVYTAEKAFEDYQLHLSLHHDLYNETEETQRAMMSRRLTELWAKNHDDLATGKTTAIDRGLRIIDRQMKLYGLEKMKRVDLEFDIEQVVDRLMKQTGTPAEKKPDVIRQVQKLLADEQAKQDRPRSGMVHRSSKD